MNKAIDNWKAGLSEQKSPDSDCSGCVHFHDETKEHDEIRWGECWAHPPQMLVMIVEDCEQAVSVSCTVQLPYVCGSFKPRLQ